MAINRVYSVQGIFDVWLRLVPLTLRDTSGTGVSETGVSERALDYDIEVLLALALQTSRTSGLKKRRCKRDDREGFT